MDQAEFENIVHSVLEGLPVWVRESMHNVEILVVDDPDEVPDAAGTDLLGLYIGIPLPERDSNYAWELPDVIYLFRKSHLALDLPGAELQDEIATTLIHEIAHYFGFDDDQLDALGWG